MAAERREVGKTADVGYQIGVRRTLPTSEERLWEVLLSPEGLQAWLGGETPLDVGTRFSFPDGTSGAIRVNTPGSHLRLQWHRQGLERPSTLQVRVLPARTGTTVSFHQEHLASPDERAAMKAHWERVVEQLEELL